MIFVSVLCRPPPSSVSSESPEAIRSIRAGSGGSEHGCEPLAGKIFAQVCSICLTARCGRFRARARRAPVSRAARSSKSRTARNAIFHRCFRRCGPISHAALLARIASRVTQAEYDPRNATCGVDRRANTLDYAKTLVFLPRCSNSEAVFAIPAGTGRYRHSLMARRAAWRRSERRRRSQRQRRAQRRPSAGRRSNYALLPSLRLRTTSMTASNEPARVEER